MAQCITCGSELHPDRARKYNYCMAPACQEKNLKGLTMVAVGVNKAADQYLLLDEQTRDELASGKFRDQRRGSFGTSLPSSSPAAGAGLAARRCSARSPPPVPAPPGITPGAAPPVEQVPGETGASLQRARTAAAGDSRQTRLEHLYRDPDHPHLAKPGKALSEARPWYLAPDRAGLGRGICGGRPRRGNGGQPAFVRLASRACCPGGCSTPAAARGSRPAGRPTAPTRWASTSRARRPAGDGTSASKS